MLKRILFILILLQSILTIAQDIPVGDWRDHLPYSDAVSVSYGDNVVYCATNSAVFTYDISDNLIERLNLVNGLSDIGLSRIKYNSYNKKVIIAYTNGNIDILDENKNIINLSFIKTSSIIGSKVINHIFLQGKLAYLSTGFGIVVLDTDKQEIVDTYLFGPLGSYVFTNAVTIDNANIYAATDIGVFYADKNSANLVDYNAWTLLPELGTQNYGGIVSFSNKLFTFSKNIDWNEDTLYYNDSGIWQKFNPNGFNVNCLNVSQDKLFISYYNKVEQYDPSLTVTNSITQYKGNFNVQPLEATIGDGNYILIADQSHGLLRMDQNWGGENISPNGPSSSNTFAMDFEGDELWVVSGGYGIGLNDNIINHQSKGSWETMPASIQNSQNNKIADLVSITVNPDNPNNVFAGSWSSGLLEFNNGSLTQIYNAQNSVLDSLGGLTVTGPLAFDEDNNLWIANSFTANFLTVKTPSNSWYNYSFLGLTGALHEFHSMVVDQNNYKWIVNNTDNSIVVFDDNNTIDDKNDDRSVLLTDVNTTSPNSSYTIYDASIPGSDILCIAEDKDGEMWLGTDEGIAVFYSAPSVFEQNIYAEQIYVQQDGQTQILFESEIITTIAVDGANRKWIGTQNSGVFLMSEDGTEQIEHFNTDNSPLFSNSIFDIVINHKTGEVFFGTEKGLISYKGTATEADEDFHNVYVYPNPVKPDFNGKIAIRGLVKDTDVKITDISGNIVYQTTSLGGQAIWDGKDFNGKKVQTGVYMIFNGSPEGDLKAVAKILFIH